MPAGKPGARFPGLRGGADRNIGGFSQSCPQAKGYLVWRMEANKFTAGWSLNPRPTISWELLIPSKLAGFRVKEKTGF
jgi:hypothetical protein